MNDIVFLNGEYTTHSSAKISIDDRGFHFGDGMYDVMLVHNSKMVDFDLHYQRMQNTAKRIYLNLDYSKEKIYAVAQNLIQQNKIEQGRVIVVISRGDADRWLVDLSSIKQNFLIIAQDNDCGVGKKQLKFLKLKTYNDIRWKYRDIKITSLLPSVILRHEAEKEGFDEVLYYNQNNNLVHESSRSNIFIIKGNIVQTPPLSENLLPGITRFRLVEVVNNFSSYQTKLNLSDITKDIILKLKIVEENFSIEELKQADEVFVTSSTARIAGITKIDDTTYTKNSTTLALLELYDAWIKMITCCKN